MDPYDILIMHTADPAIEMEILRQGSVYAHDCANALSPHGIAMWSAIKKGFLRYQGRSNGGSVYTITQDGRVAIEKARVDHLASIGVYEVR